MKNEYLVSFEEAKKRLPKRKMIHTFREAPFGLLGAEWSKRDILKALKTHAIKETGPMAKGANHGLAIHDEHGWLFIETMGVK